MKRSKIIRAKVRKSTGTLSRKKKAPKESAGDSAIESAFAAMRDSLAWVQTSSKRMKTMASEVGADFENHVGVASASVSGFLAQPELLKWLEAITSSSATIYDKALDAEYLRSHIGGSNHRLFDGGHDLISAWSRVAEASGDDTLSEEVVGFVVAVWKDVTTPMGLPFSTLDKANFDSWVAQVNDLVPFVDSKYLYDLVSFDVFEILAGALGASSIIFALNKADQKYVWDILGSMGVSSIASANPLMGIATVALVAYSYSKHGKMDGKKLARGASTTALSLAIFGLLGFPILVEIIIVMAVGAQVKKHIFSNADLAAFLAKSVADSGASISDLSRLIQQAVNR